MDVFLLLAVAGLVTYGIVRLLKLVLPREKAERQKVKQQKAENITLNSADVEVQFFEIAHWLKKDEPGD